MKNIVIKKKDFCYFLLYLIIIIPLFEIPYLNATIPGIYRIYNYTSIISMVLSLFLLLKDKSFSKYELFIILFCAILLGSTILNNGDVSKTILTIIPIFSFSLIIRYGLKKHPKIFLNSLEFFLYSLVFINFLSLIIYPNGMYASDSISFYTTNNWILGFKNNHITYIFPALLVSIINSYYSKDKLNFRTILLMLISLYNVLFVRSSTSIIGLILVIGLTILVKKEKGTKIININTLNTIFIILFFTIVIFRLQEIFSFFIVDILKKDITLTNRTYIWDYVIEFIKQKPFLGYGIEDVNVRYYKTYVYQSFHAHNQLLEIIYNVGFIGFIVFLTTFFMSTKELSKHKDSKLSKIVSIVIFSFFIMALTEAYALEYMFFIIAFGYNIRYLIIR